MTYLKDVFGRDVQLFDKFFVGFDDQVKRMQQLHDDFTKNIPNYPPYNIKKVDEGLGQTDRTGNRPWAEACAVAGEVGDEDLGMRRKLLAERQHVDARDDKAEDANQGGPAPRGAGAREPPAIGAQGDHSTGGADAEDPEAAGHFCALRPYLGKARCSWRCLR